MQYRVMCPEFWFNARIHRAGDTIEADDTMEINTNVLLGRLAPQPGAVVERAVQSPVPPAQPARRLTITELDAIPEPETPRRKYLRRDMTAS